jgi:DNA-binding IclR family transcriptional regulator
VRMAELARQLGVPYETTRRHVGWLVARGFCLRHADGLRYPPAIVTAPEAIKTAATNLANLKRLFRQTEELLLATAPTAEPLASVGQAHQPLGLRDAL